MGFEIHRQLSDGETHSSHLNIAIIPNIVEMNKFQVIKWICCWIRWTRTCKVNQNIHTSDKDLDFKWLWSIQCKIMSTTSTNKSTNSPRLDSIRSSTKCKISALLLARTWWLTLMLSAWALAAKLEIFDINSWSCNNRVKFRIRISGYAFKPKIYILSPDQKWLINQFDISWPKLTKGVKNDTYTVSEGIVVFLIWPWQREICKLNLIWSYLCSH